MKLRIAIRCAVVSGLAALCLVGGPASGQPAPKIINSAAETNYPPFGIKDPETGEPRGFNRDLFEAMAKKVGAKVNWTFYSGQDVRSWAPLKTGRVDIYGDWPMAGTPARRTAGDVSFIDYVAEPYYIVSLKTSNFRTWEDMCGKKVAIIRSAADTHTVFIKKYSDSVCLKATKPPVIAAPVEDTATALLEMKQGRVDGYLMGALNMASVNRSDGDRYEPVGGPLAKAKFGMAFSNRNKALGESLLKALNELIADGTYAQLLTKWQLTPVQAFSVGRASINSVGDPTDERFPPE
ncbi:hypothetical protein AOQ72_16770 [Bradyrhizobium yuanmingense]|uniref:Solute-binding protein family 3/N-terminal domain-containing protein n=1 Tax=Bradyrhizobium yuanmingense TaxID=108015 RepID=A0A0R3CMA6_9BRAD|nr:transporter substrate-binding domain-containing protein [Bradyrhizobium yuanmingense]KRP98754.1 hypothetical protein AOQ72_16770 [Bradyrhizobium yuanmingense]